MHPDVGAIVVHENGDIAHDADRPLRAVTPQRAPLFVESELDPASNAELVSQFLACFLQSGRVPIREVMRPLRRLSEKTDNIVHWSEFDRGGHFAGMEVPDLLIDDIRTFFRRFRLTS